MKTDDKEATMQATLENNHTNSMALMSAPEPIHPSLVDIGHARLFNGAEPEILEGWLGACEVRDLAADEVLIAAGAVNTAIYIILSGRLCAHLGAPDGETTGMFEAGESVGELSMIDQRPAPSSVFADAPTRLLVIPREVFWALVESSHAVARNVLVCLRQQLHHRNDLAANNQRLHKDYLRQTLVDALTGLHNRRWFENALKRQALRSGMSSDPLSLVLLDIDRFDRTNRAFGDEAGDAILRAVAHHLGNAIRPTDLIARFGADGFAIALPGATLENARVVARRLQADIAEAVIVMDDGGILPPVTASGGVAELRGGAGVEGLMCDATSALKEARNQGTNMVRG
jgi:diguanylate cyclase (GGDEF)-like protein